MIVKKIVKNPPSPPDPLTPIYTLNLRKFSY